MVILVTARYALLDEIPGQARARLRLYGPDTRRFLQGTLTADIESLAPRSALAAALCTVKGKLVSELLLIPGADEDEVHAIVPADEASGLAEHFDKHIIMDDVEVESLGPVSAALVWHTPGPGEAPEGIEAFATSHPASGWLCLGTREQLDEALAAYTVVDAPQWDAYRIANGRPAWGRELLAGFFPPEVGFVYAVSFDKGCFLGQEPLARIHARGQVNRVLVRVHADRAPAEAVTLASDERPDVGKWTSWAPAEAGGVDGLAVVVDVDAQRALGAGGGERAHVFGVERSQSLADAVGQPFVLEELTEGMRRGSEAGGHSHALGQLGDHLAEGGVLAPHRLDVAHSQVFKRNDQGGRFEQCRHGKAPEVETGSAPAPTCSERGGRAPMQGSWLCCSGSGQPRCMVMNWE